MAQAFLKFNLPQERLKKAADAIDGLAWLAEIGAIKSDGIIEIDGAPIAKFISDGLTVTSN